jgi:hypothetical protein
MARASATATNAGRYCEELLLLNPGKPDKKRTVLSVQGKLRTAQYRLLHRALLPSLLPSECSHGGVRRRSIKTNFQVHAHSNFAFATDISNFYPSIPVLIPENVPTG